MNSGTVYMEMDDITVYYLVSVKCNAKRSDVIVLVTIIMAIVSV